MGGRNSAATHQSRFEKLKYLHCSPKRERKIPAHMQGGDFLYGSAGAPKDEQQPNTIEKKGKKNFQLSKILPSPSKKGSQSTKQASSEIVQDVSLPSNEKKRPRGDHYDQEESAEIQETDAETSDGDWYAFIC